jgi:hypothetical protein
MDIRIGKVSSLASILGGVVFAFLGVAWAITHGSTSINQNEIWLGIGNLAYSQMNVVYSLCFIVAVWGFGRVARLNTKWAKPSYQTALICLSLHFISQILQYYIVNPLVDWESLVVTLGFLVYWVSWTLFGFSMMILGLSLQEYGRGSQILIFLLGLLTILTFFTQGFWLGAIRDESTRDIVLGVLKIPLSLCWVALGIKINKYTYSNNDWPTHVERHGTV